MQCRTVPHSRLTQDIRRTDVACGTVNWWHLIGSRHHNPMTNGPIVRAVVRARSSVVRDRSSGGFGGRPVRGSVRGSGELGTGSGYGFGVRVRVWEKKSSGAATANGSSTNSSLQTDGASPQAIYEPGANFIPLHRWPSSFDQKITTSNDGVT